MKIVKSALGDASDAPLCYFEACSLRDMNGVLSKIELSRSSRDRLSEYLFLICLSLMVLVPLAFSTAVYRAYVVPRYGLLILGTSLIVLLLALIARRDGLGIIKTDALRSWHITLVCLYFFVVLLSTIFGTARVASTFGSSYNQMGLVTRLCFFVFFIALIIAVGASELRLRRALWAMAFTGLVIATYAYVQFFGRDPFSAPSTYTFGSGTEPIIRVHSTLGHPNFLGNFLLYTTLLTAGLAVASQGRARRIGFAATLISTAAIVFSGTRGAWVGMIAGVIVFITLWILDRVKPGFQILNRRVALRALVAVAVIVLLGWAVSTNTVSRSIEARARSLAAEGFTGAGRTLLWRDALRMVPDFALIGCGPEAFRKEFLAYKSIELARHAPRTNNESSHNSYMDAAISFGLIGIALYVALITSSLVLILKARRRAKSGEMKAILTGLAAAMIAVIVHNFFIFDQIPTGLYFFAFVALAFIADRMSKEDFSSGSNRAEFEMIIASGWRWAGNVIVGSASIIVLIALWYSVTLVVADRAIGRAFAAANSGDYEKIVNLERQVTQAADPTGSYGFLLAQALTLCAEKIQSLLDAEGRSQDERQRLMETRSRAIEMAITSAKGSVRYTLTPDSVHLLLAYLGLLSGDKELLRIHASEAVRLDPNLSNARWLMAEAFLADGDRKQAEREARLARDLNPYSSEARRVLRRAQGRREGQKRD